MVSDKTLKVEDVETFDVYADGELLVLLVSYAALRLWLISSTHVSIVSQTVDSHAHIAHTQHFHCFSLVCLQCMVLCEFFIWLND